MKYFFLFLFLGLASTFSSAQKKQGFPIIGIAENIERDSLIQTFGYQCLIESTSKLLSPRNVSDIQFQAILKKIKTSRVPLLACNLFIPGDLKVVGPAVDEKAVLAYVETVFKRAKEAGLKMIVWGSGGSRGVPEGFDRIKAKAQFIDMARKVAGVAAQYNIVLALENLNSTECNFITTAAEAIEVVKAVNHPSFRLCIDMYHMLKEGESPQSIAAAKGYIIHCEVAEKEGRTPPGVHGDDFKLYFIELKKIGYYGQIVIECKFVNVESQGAAAYLALKKQIEEIYNQP